MIQMPTTKTMAKKITNKIKTKFSTLYPGVNVQHNPMQCCEEKANERENFVR